MAQLYYHFLSYQNALDDLLNERIRVSRIEELNDPFELRPYLRYDFRKRKKYHEVYRAVSEKYGILCFCKNRKEPTLWAHYADKHRGIALGFNISEKDVFDIDYNYENLRTEFNLSGDQKTNEELFLNLARKKYKKWSYEEESRIIVNLSECIKRGSHYFFPFSQRLNLTEIILGCRFERKNEEEIRKIATRKGLNLLYTRYEWQGFNITKNGSKANLI